MQNLRAMNLLPPSNGVQGQLVLLAPSGAIIPEVFADAKSNPHRHDLLLAGVQRLRGALYLQEGAIQASQLSSDGRHRAPVDEHAWHIVLLDEEGGVAGCARYMAYGEPVTFSGLGVAKSALAPRRNGGIGSDMPSNLILRPLVAAALLMWRWAAGRWPPTCDAARTRCGLPCPHMAWRAFWVGVSVLAP